MSSGGGSQPVTIGYQYFLSMHLALCHGPVDSIDSIKGGDIAVIWDGHADHNQDISVNQPNLFGGKMKEGGVQGTFSILMGATDQQPDPWLRTAIGNPVELPAFRGVTSILWKDMFYSSNTATPKPWQVLTTRIPLKFLTGADAAALGTALYADIAGEANPAYITAESLMSYLWGLGYTIADLDTDSFRLAAQILHAEGFGLSVLWEDSSSVEDFLNIILQHCNAALFVSPKTGKFTFKLIRGGYDISTLFVADESNIVELEEMSQVGISELVNQITVKWIDAITGQWRSLTVHNPAVREVQKSIVAITREYGAVTSTALAKTLALRDISVMSQPLAPVKLVLNRTASGVSIGDVIVWNWPDLGTVGRVLRVLSVGYGNLDAGEVSLECVEDVFGVNHVQYTLSNGTEWVDPTPAPQVSPAQLSINPTYMDVFARLGYIGRTIADLTPHRGFNMLLAAQPNVMTTHYELWVAQGTGSYTYNKQVPFNPFAKMIALVPPEDYSTFTVGSSLNSTWIQPKQYAICNGEWMYVDTVSLNTTTNVVTLGCWRGVADTTPGFLYAESDIWFYDNSQVFDYTDYADLPVPTVVHSKARTHTVLGLLPLESATDSINAVDARWMRPYPPANLRINGSRYPATVTGDIVLTWAHRHRINQAWVITHQNEASMSAPEIGTTYTVRVLSQAGIVLHTVEGLIAATYTYTLAQSILDGAGTNFYIAVVAVRDGLASYGAHFSAISYSGSALNSFPAFGNYDPSVPVLADHIEITYLNAKGLDSQGFSGQDAVLYWEDNHVALFGTGTKFSLTEQADWFQDYKVVISKGGVVRRTVYVTIPEYVYTYDQNVIDGLSRTFDVTVCVRDVYGALSPTRGLVTGNLAPVFSEPVFKPKPRKGALLIHVSCTDPALQYINVYASKTNGFTPDASNLAYRGSDFIITVPTPGDGAWFLRFEGVDDFGTFGTIMSDQYQPDVTAPGPPTFLKAEALFRSVALHWINPTDVDFDHVEIYMGNTATFDGTANLVAKSAGDNFLVTGLPVSMAPHYFWVRALDTSGNVGAFNAVAGTSSGTLEEAAFQVGMLAGVVGSSALNTELGARIAAAEAGSTTAVVAVSEKVDHLNASYTVKIDANGYVSGYGLASETNTVTGEALSSFAIRADTFSIATPHVPASPGQLEILAAKHVPFMVKTTEEEIDGVIFKPGVYMDSAFITKITADQINSKGLNIKDADGNVIFGVGLGGGTTGKYMDYSGMGGATAPAANATRNVFVGLWHGGTTYYIGDIVTWITGNGFICLTEHTDTIAPVVGVNWGAYTVRGNNGTNGIDGSPGISVHRGIAFYRGNPPDLPIVPISNVIGGSYDFSSGVLHIPISNLGWDTVRPDTFSIPTYSCEFTFITETPTTPVDAGTWSPIRIEAVAGSDGNSLATVHLYAQADIAPTLPTGTSYSFGAELLMGNLNGWSRYVPPSTETTTWVTTCFFSGGLVTIESSEWSTPVTFSRNGTNGIDGSPGTDGVVSGISVNPLSAGTVGLVVANGYQIGSGLLTVPGIAISNDCIKIFDGGVIRVQLGNLSI